MAVSRAAEWLFEVKNTARNEFLEGHAMKVGTWFAIVYVVITFGALIAYAFSPFHNLAEITGWWRLVPIAIGVFVSAGPPLFFWTEARAFDQWLNAKVPDAKAQKRWRETYKLNADNAKAFWAAILAVYAAVLLKW